MSATVPVHIELVGESLKEMNFTNGKLTLFLCLDLNF